MFIMGNYQPLGKEKLHLYRYFSALSTPLLHVPQEFSGKKEKGHTFGKISHYQKGRKCIFTFHPYIV